MLKVGPRTGRRVRGLGEDPRGGCKKRLELGDSPGTGTGVRAVSRAQAWGKDPWMAAEPGWDLNQGLEEVLTGAGSLGLGAGPRLEEGPWWRAGPWAGRVAKD